ncbi:Rv3654c family TadE-like protein [Streptomyces sp. B1I3]|uniref:Rv3654c family TadE-like protein n=1 Tax=Streptomyces sp. B1I3 TaxID=3042264 RepID=UPI0027D803C3|nr:Rv3654c family TadE-like protein [Streptomyces sp. B1I3]
MTTATLCAVFATVLALGQAVAARHKAGGAADLAALAAADRALRGAATACGAARDVAAAQGAEVVRCSVEGEIADVTARARFGPYAPEVRSRAGPPAATPSPRVAAPRPRLPLAALTGEQEVAVFRPRPSPAQAPPAPYRRASARAPMAPSVRAPVYPLLREPAHPAAGAASPPGQPKARVRMPPGGG